MVRRESVVHKLETNQSEIIGQRCAGQIRTFLAELENETDNYESIHSITRQITYDYHSRFLFELLQNAHDALQIDGKVQIVFNEDTENLYVANTGEPFSKKNFESISKLGQSTKDPAISIGNKGIGFKSVLEITKCPRVYSGPVLDGTYSGYCFYFTPQIYDWLLPVLYNFFSNEENSSLEDIVGQPMMLNDWSSDKIHRVKLQLLAGREESELYELLKQEIERLSPYQLPIPAQIQDEWVLSFGEQGYSTVVQLPLEGQKALEKVIAAMENLDAKTLLFLPKLSEMQFIHIVEGKQRAWNYSKTCEVKEEFQEVTMFEDGEMVASYFLSSKTSTLETAEFSEALLASADNMPPEWQTLKKATVSIAIERDTIVPTGLFYIYFPTEMATGLPLCINGPFFGDMTRKHIDTTIPWNAYLIKEAGKQVFQLVQGLSSQRPVPKESIIDLLAFSSSHKDESHIAPNLVYVGLNEALNEREIKLAEWKVIPTDHKNIPCGSIKQVHLVQKWQFLKYLHPNSLNNIALYILDEARRENYKKLAFLANITAEPGEGIWARWVGKTAKRLLNEKVKFEEWQEFYGELNKIYKNLSRDKFIELLKKEQIVLCSDGALHTIPGDDDKILFLSPNDTEVSKRSIPVFIANRFVFLHPKISLTDDTGDLILFLDKLAEDFNIEMIMEKVVLPAYEAYTVDNHSDQELYEMLSWLDSLVKNSSELEKISDIGRVLVPCRGGWLEAKEAFASSDWVEEFEHAPALERLYLDCDSKWGKNLLLPFASLSRFQEGLSRKRVSRLFRTLGVTDCLRINKGQFWIMGNSTGCRFVYNRSLPDEAEPLMRQWVNFVNNPHSGRSLQYTVESWFTPQIDVFIANSKDGHPNLPYVLISSIKQWESDRRTRNWDEALVIRSSPYSLTVKTRSLLPLLLANTPWLPDRENKHFYRPYEIVFIPKPITKHTPIPYVNKVFAEQIKDLATRMADKIELLHGDVPSVTIGSKLLNFLARKFNDSKPEHEQMYKSFYKSVWENFLEQLQNKKEVEFPEIRSVLVQTDKGLKVLDANAIFYLATNDEKGLRNRLLNTGRIDILYAELSKKEMLLLQSGYGWRVIPDLQQIIDAEDAYAMNGVSALCGGERKWLQTFTLAIACFAHGNSMKPDSSTFRKAKDLLEKAELYFTKNLTVTLLDEKGEVIQREEVEWAIDHEHKKWFVKEGTRFPQILADGLSQLLDNSTLFYPLFAATRKMDSMDISRGELLAILEEMSIQGEEIAQIEILLNQDLPIFRDKIHPVLLALDLEEAEVEYMLQQETIEKIEERLIDIFSKEDANIIVAAMGKSTDEEVSRTLYEQYGLLLSDFNRGVSCPSVDRPPIVNQNLRFEFEAWKTQNRSLMLTPIRVQADLDKDGIFYKNALVLWEQWKIPERWFQEDWELDEGKVVSEAKIWLSQFDILLSSESLVQEIEDCYGEIIPPEEILKENQSRAKRFGEKLLDLDAAVSLKSGGKVSSLVELGELLETSFPEYMVRFQWKLLSDQEILSSLLDQFPLLKQKAPQGIVVLEELQDMFQVKSEDLEQARVSRKDHRRIAREAKQRLARTLVIGGLDFEATEENLPDMWTFLEPLANQMIIKGGLDQPVKSFPGKDKNPGGRSGGGGGYSRGGGQNVNRPSKEQTEATGYAGELLVYHYLKEHYPEAVTLESWVSRNRRFFCPGEEGLDDHAGYDFKFFANTCEYQIEVKATKGSSGYFEMGSTETDAARNANSAQQAGKPVIYRIAFITDVLNQPSINFLPNPFSKEGLEFYSNIRDSGAKVWFKV